MGMEDVLRIDKILDFCDVPQLFVARDAFDTLYLCLLYDDETVYRYTGIRISTRRLESFLAGKADCVYSIYSLKMNMSITMLCFNRVNTRKRY